MTSDELVALGEKLREARLQRDLTLQEVESELRIRARFIEGLENGQPDSSLSEMQVRGFLRNYATLLRLNPDEILQSYEEAKLPKKRRLFYSAAPKKTAPLTPTPQRLPVPPTPERPVLITIPDDDTLIPDEESGRNLVRTLLFGGLALILVGMVAAGAYIVMVTLTDSNSTENALANPPIQVTVSDATTQPGQSDVLSAPTLTETPQGTLAVAATIQPNFVGANELRMVVTAKQRSWLRITVDGAVQFQGVLRPGTGVEYVGRESIRLRTANAGGLEVLLNNQPLGILGEHSQEYDQTFTLDTQPPAATPVPTLTPFMTPTLAAGAQIIEPSATQVSIASTTAQQASNGNAPTPLPTLPAFSTETNTPTSTLTFTPTIPTLTPTPTPTLTFTPTDTPALPERITRTPRP